MPEGQPEQVPADGLTTRQRRNQPLLMVHTGDGKGKSTAAFGLALRGWNQGWSIGVFQFVKSAKWRIGEQTALEALAELRRVLGVLRDGDGAPETAPQPDLAGIDQLLASSRAAGLAVTMTSTGRPPPAPGGIGLTTYRVLQESLSNALRHAPGAAVRVQLAYHDDRLELRVENDPPPNHRPPNRTRGGQGLTGMRERVGAYGGTLTTGPTAAGGFAVAATIPYDSRALVDQS
jgi:signal transduction histidine kinase